MKKISINVTKTELPSLAEYYRYLKKIWRSSWITNNGQYVQQLESRLAEYLGVKYLLLVANGTLALQLALKVFKLEGEIITTPFTFPATTNAIIWEGLTPVFADINPETFNINPEEIEKKITPRTSAILAVHVYGNPCHNGKIKKIAARHRLKIIYDAAHAFGVCYQGRSVLKWGDISTLSFHATKIFSTAEGGAVIVKSKKIYERLKLLRNFGIKNEEEVELAGINAKMNELQAALGLCNLDLVDRKIEKNKKIFKLYRQSLGVNRQIMFQKLISAKHNYCYMPVLFPNRRIRDSVYNRFLSRGIKPRKYFYPDLTAFDYIKKLSNKNPFSSMTISRNIAGRVLCLPIYSSLKYGDIKTIVGIINKELDG